MNSNLTQRPRLDLKLGGPKKKLKTNMTSPSSTILKKRLVADTFPMKNAEFIPFDGVLNKSLQSFPLRAIRSLEATPRKPLQNRVFHSPKPVNGSENQVSYVEFLKNQSFITFKPIKKTLSPKCFSPRVLTTRQQLTQNKLKNRVHDDKTFRKAINASNGIDSIRKFSANYLVYIGPGNNSSLIKRVFASRPWWTIANTKEKANFVWTQWKDSKFLATLQSCTNKTYTPDYDSTKIFKSANSFNTGLDLITNSPSFISLYQEKSFPEILKMHNKLEHNQKITNKKDLFFTLKAYYSLTKSDISSTIPLTFHVALGETDEEFLKFSSKFLEFSNKPVQNIWIIKPGEFTNRGQGIKVSNSLEEITEQVKSTQHTHIIQKYIENPMLFCKRKFDIRCYSLVTCINGITQAYFYQDGYLRTASQEYSTKDVSNQFIHLTNDAIQKHSKEYGKFENGNKLSYLDFQRYLNRISPEKPCDFVRTVLPKIKMIVKETVSASFQLMDPVKRENTMEIFGYDFMVDRKMKPFLIEVNTNPCLELASKYLAVIIPNMIENAVKIAVDSVFPPPSGEYVAFAEKNKFELIFHELVDGKNSVSK